MSTKEIRQEANALLVKAEAALSDDNVEGFEGMISDAQGKMEQADKIDAAASQLKKLQGEFQTPVNTVPIADKDVAAYDPSDSGARNKASYKPSSWVKGMPASAQPIWVQ